MKTDRERLITLLNDFVCTLASCDKPTCNECNADYLISKGVTIPVRCGECKYNVANMKRDPLDATDYTDIVCSYFMTDGMEANDFCSYGERR